MELSQVVGVWGVVLILELRFDPDQFKSVVIVIFAQVTRNLARALFPVQTKQSWTIATLSKISDAGHNPGSRPHPTDPTPGRNVEHDLRARLLGHSNGASPILTMPYNLFEVLPVPGKFQAPSQAPRPC